MTGKFPAYPHITRIERLEPNPQSLLGKRLTWTEKRDGSCCAFWLGEDGSRRLSSRNMEVMAPDLSNKVLLEKETVDGIYLMLSEQKFTAVYAEYVFKGYGPTRIEGIQDKAELIVFDILDRELFLPYSTCINTVIIITYLSLIDMVSLNTPRWNHCSYSGIRYWRSARKRRGKGRSLNGREA